MAAIGLHGRPLGWPYARAPTVHDLAVRYCFICTEEDTSRARPAIGWVHPCKCTLVAHERCLLSWIDTAPPNAREARMKCSSCGTPYHISRKSFRSLGIFRRFDQAVARVGGTWFIFSLAGVGLGIFSACASFAFSHGYMTARLMLGNRLCAYIFPENGAWSIAAACQLPVMPFVFCKIMHPQVRLPVELFSEISFAILPSLPPLALGQSNTLGNQFWRLVRQWPPHPRLIAILYPFIRIGYKRAYGWMHKRFVRNAIPPNTTYSHAAAWHHSVHLQADGDFYIQTRRDAADGVNVFVGPMADPPDKPVIPVGRTMLGLWTIPPLVAAIGRGLRWLSLRYSWLSPLRRFLGARQSVVNYESLMALSPTWHWTYFEPVWWHSAIGLGLFILARDAYQLVREALFIREFYTRQVADLPFTNVDLGENAFILDE
ncbi:hypothetical protein BKA62DRAFT_654726 [Auriculariales sp. MPI-PUGE-AT-0066]|nr:hypothetical protein BKA62DRAFT_654726 [Auriculariales sp. MPI-PUGE-AT-0066]